MDVLKGTRVHQLIDHFTVLGTHRLARSSYKVTWTRSSSSDRKKYLDIHLEAALERSMSTGNIADLVVVIRYLLSSIKTHDVRRMRPTSEEEIAQYSWPPHMNVFLGRSRRRWEMEVPCEKILIALVGSWRFRLLRFNGRWRQHAGVLAFIEGLWISGAHAQKYVIKSQKLLRSVHVQQSISHM